MNQEVERAVKSILREKFKKMIVEYGQVAKPKEICEDFNVSKSTYYLWRQKYNSEGMSGLKRKKTNANYPANKTSPEIIEKY